MSEALIRMHDLGFAWGEVMALAGVSLEVRAGEIVGLVGPDGAGKSTLLRIGVGQLPPARGTVQVLGGTPGDLRLRARIAYMPQRFGLYPDLSVLENLRFFADLHGLPEGEALPRIQDLLARTGLAGFEARRAGQLSGGMMQKLALACALVSSPRAMFLDEPTTGVDPLSRRAFWQLLEQVRAEGVAILYATANMDEAERCDRVVVLREGRMFRQGTPEALAREGDMHLVAVSGPRARHLRRAVRELPGVARAFPVGARLHVWLEPGVGEAAFAAQLTQLDAHLVARGTRPTLHDVTLRDLTQDSAP
ncbi:MAG: ABC transporter ATP-binding protein [Thiohalomonadaceae bacterium]